MARRNRVGRTFAIGQAGPMQVPTDVSIGRRKCSDGKVREWHAGWTIISSGGQVNRAIRNYDYGGMEMVTLRYPARPVMQPALEKSKEKLVSFFQDSLF